MTKTRITKRDWQRMGGFENPQVCRVSRNGQWAYYKLP
jgi:hypothetical protein